MTKEQVMTEVESSTKQLNHGGIPEGYALRFIAGARFGAGQAYDMLVDNGTGNPIHKDGNGEQDKLKDILQRKYAKAREQRNKALGELDIEREHAENWERAAGNLLRRAEKAEAELKSALLRGDSWKALVKDLRAENEALRENRNRFCEVINKIGRLGGMKAENLAPDAVLRNVEEALRNRPVLRELSNETAPTPEQVLTVDAMGRIYLQARENKRAWAATDRYTRALAEAMVDSLQPYLTSSQTQTAPPESNTREEWHPCDCKGWKEAITQGGCFTWHACPWCGKSLIKRFRKVTLERWTNVYRSSQRPSGYSIGVMRENPDNCPYDDCNEKPVARAVHVPIPFWEEVNQ